MAPSPSEPIYTAAKNLRIYQRAFLGPQVTEGFDDKSRSLIQAPYARVGITSSLVGGNETGLCVERESA